MPVEDPHWSRDTPEWKSIGERKEQAKKRAKSGSTSKKRASLHCPSPHQRYWRGLGVKHSENGGKRAGGREVLG